MFAVKSPFIQTSKFKQEGENNWTRKRDFSRLPTSSASRRRSLGPPTPEDSSILSVHRSRSSSRTKAASPSPSLGRSRSYSVTRPMIASPGPVDWSHQNNLSPRRRYRARAALPSPLPSPSPSPSPLPSPLPSPSLVGRCRSHSVSRPMMDSPVPGGSSHRKNEFPRSSSRSRISKHGDERSSPYRPTNKAVLSSLLDIDRSKEPATQTLDRHSKMNHKSPALIRDISVFRIQAAFRGYQGRREALIRMGALLTLQENIRIWLRGNQVKRRAALSIQSIARRRLALKKAASLRNAIVFVQSWCRGAKIRNEIAYLRSNALILQSTWRMHCGRKLCQILTSRKEKTRRDAALNIQASYRRHIAHAAFLERLMLVTRIQSAARGSIVKKQYLENISKIVTLQAASRRAIAKNKYQLKINAVRLLQTWTRKALAEREYQLRVKTLVGLQAWTRKVISERQLQSTLRTVIILQAWTRKTIAQREQRDRVLARARSAVILQAWLRGTMSRIRFKPILNAAVQLQANFRMISSRRNYMQTRDIREASATAIQKAWRQYSCEMTYLDILIAATIQQSYFRRLAAQQKYQATLIAIVKIQSSWRMRLAKNVMKEKVEREEEMNDVKLVPTTSIKDRIHQLNAGVRKARHSFASITSSSNGISNGASQEILGMKFTKNEKNTSISEEVCKEKEREKKVMTKLSVPIAEARKSSSPKSKRERLSPNSKKATKSISPTDSYTSQNQSMQSPSKHSCSSSPPPSGKNLSYADVRKRWNRSGPSVKTSEPYHAPHNGSGLTSSKANSSLQAAAADIPAHALSAGRENILRKESTPAKALSCSKTMEGTSDEEITGEMAGGNDDDLLSTHNSAFARAKELWEKKAAVVRSDNHKPALINKNFSPLTKPKPFLRQPGLGQAERSESEIAAVLEPNPSKPTEAKKRWGERIEKRTPIKKTLSPSSQAKAKLWNSQNDARKIQVGFTKVENMKCDKFDVCISADSNANESLEVWEGWEKFENNQDWSPMTRSATSKLKVDIVPPQQYEKEADGKYFESPMQDYGPSIWKPMQNYGSSITKERLRDGEHFMRKTRAGDSWMR